MITLQKYLRKIWLRISILGISVFILASIFIFLFFVNGLEKGVKLSSPTEYLTCPLIIEIPVRYELSVEMGLEIQKIDNLRITCYTNRVEECDSTPNITATGRIVYEGSCAISQDLFRVKVKPGDIVYVETIKKYFVVEDTMNKKNTQHLDIFMFKKHLKKARQFSCRRSSVYVLRVRR